MDIFSGCQSNDGSTTEAQKTETANEATVAGTGQIVLSGSSITAGDGVTVDGTTATITAVGSYEISGTLDDGQIIVDTSSEVTLVLNNANINCTTSSPIYIVDAKKIVVTLADNSVNTLTDGTSYSLKKLNRMLPCSQNQI